WWSATRTMSWNAIALSRTGAPTITSHRARSAVRNAGAAAGTGVGQGASDGTTVAGARHRRRAPRATGTAHTPSRVIAEIIAPRRTDCGRYWNTTVESPAGTRTRRNA